MSMDMPYIEREINGTLYRAYILKLDKWAELTEFLASLLGEPLASVLRGDAQIMEGIDPSLSRMDFESVLFHLVNKITKRTILELTGHMAGSLRANDKILKVDSQTLWWPQHMRDLCPAVALFLEAQYRDFYEGLSESLPAMPEEELNLSPRDSG